MTTFTVTSGVTSTGLTISSGDELDVLSGGTASSTMVTSNGLELVSAGGTDHGAQIVDGLLDVFGFASGATLFRAGGQLVESGGLASGTMVSGGVETVVAGGTDLGATISGGGQNLFGEQDVFGVASGAIVVSLGLQQVESGGTVSNTTVHSGGFVEVTPGGTALGVTVLAGGTAFVESGGTASNSTVNSGGVMEVTSGGKALGAVTFNGAGGKLQIDGTDASALSGATISGLVIGDAIDLAGAGFASGGTAQVTSGNVLHIVENGHTFDLHLDPTASFSGAVFRLVADGGTGTNVSIDAPPTLTGTGNASFTENGAAVTLSGAASVADPDNQNLASATVAITGGTFAGDGDVLGFSTTGTSITASYDSSTETLILTGSDTLAHYQQVLESVTFNSTSHNPNDLGSNPTRLVAWTLNDGSASNPTSTVTTTVSITAANDAPTLSSIAATATFTEKGAAVTLSGNASVADPDNLNLANATVKITGGTFAGDGDVLLANVGATSITASYNAASETLTLTGFDTLAHYQQVLDSLTFNSTGLNPTNYGSNTTRTVTWLLNDGSASNSLSATQTETVTIAAVNDAPTVSSVTGVTGFTENGAAVTASPNLTVTDPDNLTLVNATVSVANGFAGDGDVLSFSTAGTSITGSYNAATETLVLSGVDTVAHYQNVLDTVAFSTPSDNPTNYGSNLSRVLTWVVNDGSASSNLSTPQFTTVVVTAINDAPTLANVPGVAHLAIGQTLTLAPVASVNDADNQTLANATVAITAGAFAGDGDVLGFSTAGTSITASYNSTTEKLVLSGTDTLSHYQQVLDSVTFQAGANPTNSGANPTRTLSWVVNDGSASSATATTTISISSVVAVSNDYSGDGKSDLLWQNGGTFTEWQSNGSAFTPNTFVGSVGTGWTAAGVGDFSGDGKADLIWQNGATFTEWQSNGNGFTPNTFVGSVGAGWALAGVGDFSGDGKADLIWQNGATFTEWQSNGNGFTPNTFVGSVGAGWTLAGVGDFSGDGKSDLIWQNGATFTEWQSNGNGFTPNTFIGSVGAGWTLAGVGDFNGDGNNDLIWQNGATFTEWQSNGSGFTPNTFVGSVSAGWTLANVGDYNGDHKSDLIWQNGATFTEWQSNGSAFTPNTFVGSVGSGWTLDGKPTTHAQT